MRRPASSITALILPVRLRRVASGLMIEKVRSVMGLFASLDGRGNRAARREVAGSIPAPPRIAKACRFPSASWGGKTRACRSAMDPPGQAAARLSSLTYPFLPQVRRVLVRAPFAIFPMLQIKDLVFDAWGRRFFDQATVSLPKDAKVGLVGRNGVGKSTLFKLILGQLVLGSGEIGLPRAARIGSVDQEHPATPVPLLDTVLAADLERASLLARLEDADPEHMGEIYDRLIEIDADRAPSRAAEILAGLGFSNADLGRPMAEFSGGWRMRVALAASLFAAPDLLLLDEPTNYLDLEGALWLEDHLANYPRTVIVISHDRDLLDTSVDQILHLDRGRLTLYRGSYSSFEEQRATREMLDAKQAKRQDAERNRLQAFVDRFKAKASKARQAQSRVKMLEKMKPVAALVTQDVREISFPAPEKTLSPPIIALDNVSVGYDPRKPVLNRVTLRIDSDDRIALLGSNGNGKSTLV